MANDSYRPVVALDLDGVLRIPGSTNAPEVRADVLVAEVTMRQVAFPSYSHLEPPWDVNGEWMSTHTFAGAGVAWVRELVECGVDVVWVSSWGAYADVYFGRALGIPALPFMDGAGGQPDVVRWLSARFKGRPLLWVSANAGPEAVAALRAFRAPADRALTRVFLPDRYTGVTKNDAETLNGWLEVVRSEEGQAELRRRDRRRVRQRKAAVVRERWGSRTRYRRWRAARDRLEPILGEGSVLVTLLADYALEFGSDIDATDVACLREEWGRPGDPASDALHRLLLPPRRVKARNAVLTWVGSGYPHGLGGLLSRGHADGIRTLDVGRGWWPLLLALDDELARIDPDYTVSRLRSVDGRLQFEAQSTRPEWFTPAFSQIIRAAQKRAARTCERCARAGRRYVGEGVRARVLCAAHARPLTEDEIEFAVDGGVPREVFILEGALEGTLDDGSSHPTT